MKRVIYTSIIGGYDELQKIPKNDWNIKFICLTDSENIKSNYWEVIRINKVESYERASKNRHHKMFPEEYFDADQSLYIDGNIKITGDPNILFDKYLSSFDIAIPIHFNRNCSYDEIEECKKNKLINEAQASKIKDLFQNSNFPSNLGLFENNIILRNHNKISLIKAMREWNFIFNELAPRDQLSFTYCTWKHKISVGAIMEGPRFTNKYFKIILHKSRKHKNFLKKFMDHIRMNSNLNIFYSTANKLIVKTSYLIGKIS